MADFPFPHTYISVEALEGSQDDLTTQIISGAASTKGSYIEIIASTTQEYHGLIVYGRKTGGDSIVATDIAIGSAGNEEIIIPDFAISGYNSFAESSKGFFPVYIPAGSRVSARSACFIASSSAYMHLVGVAASGSGNEARTVKTYGVGSAFSGITVDPGGTANTKGAWSQITSSTTDEIRQIEIYMGKFSNTVDADASFLLDIGIGGAGSEEVLISNIVFASNTNEKLNGGLAVIPINIPAGTRIAARCQSSITDATDRVMSVSISGVS